MINFEPVPQTDQVRCTTCHHNLHKTTVAHGCPWCYAERRDLAKAFAAAHMTVMGATENIFGDSQQSVDQGIADADYMLKRLRETALVRGPTWYPASQAPNLINSDLWCFVPDMGNEDEGWGMVIVGRFVEDTAGKCERYFTDTHGRKINATSWTFITPVTSAFHAHEGQMPRPS